MAKYVEIRVQRNKHVTERPKPYSLVARLFIVLVIQVVRIIVIRAFNSGSKNSACPTRGGPKQSPFDETAQSSRWDFNT